MVGHRQAARVGTQVHHRQVIGPIAHGDGLARRDAQFSTGLLQHATLFLAIANIAPGLIDHAAGEMAILDFKHIAAGEIQAQGVAYPVGEIGEAATHQQGVQARGLAGFDQFTRAGVQAQPMLVDLLQGLRRHPSE